MYLNEIPQIQTIPDQISLLRKFLIKRVTLVGDRAMFPQAQKDDLPKQISYISLSVRDKSRPCSKTTITDVFIRRSLQEAEWIK